MNKSVTSLVVSENPRTCQYVGAVLSEEGSRVLLVSQAEEGLAHLRNKAVDVLFTDLRLSGVNGIEFIRRSQQLLPQLASVVFTEDATIESAVEALRLGVCDYVTKPIDHQTILSAYHRALRQTRFKNQKQQQREAIGTGQKPAPEDFATANCRMQEIVALANRIASLNLPVLIQGETGVGKKRLARFIHSRSQQSEGELLHIVCSAFCGAPPESGLSGSPRSGQSGNFPWNVVADLPGRNTLFLEGVDELPTWAQIQLSDLLDGSWLPDSGTEISKPGTVRVIVSTTADLEEAVAAGRFQRALYDHVNLVPIRMPPLRERREDIQPLAVYFVEQFCQSQNQCSTEYLKQLSKERLESLERYHWPGNVRELAGVLARVVLLGEDAASDRTLQNRREATPDGNETVSVPLSADFKAMERHIIREVVKRHGGNKAAAARALGLHRRTLYRVLEKGKPTSNGSDPFRNPAAILD